MSFPAWTEVCERSKVEALRDPALHADAPRTVEVIETHCSWVFLTTAFAYKMKKAMRLDLMDNRELSSRLRSCRQELSLNRRLAAGVYLEVVSLNRTGEGQLLLGGPGIAVEWLVKMKRLPAELLLHQALRAGSVRADAIDAVGGLLADFYARQPSIGIKPQEYCARFDRQIRSNGAALCEGALGLPPHLVGAVIERQGECLERNWELLAERARGGRIVEAHGDLKPEHVYLGRPAAVIDCLEFDRNLRSLDPLEEIAYFSLECERLSAGWIGKRVLELYLDRTGDHLDPAVYGFYRCRRATHRALTTAWHLRDSRERERRDWRGLAKEYLRLAISA